MPKTAKVLQPAEPEAESICKQNIWLLENRFFSVKLCFKRASKKRVGIITIKCHQQVYPFLGKFVY